MKWLLTALWLSAVTAHAVTITENGGVVVFEAEDYSNNVPNSAIHSWQFANSVAGFSGTGYMEAVPNIGTNNNVSWVGLSPELQFSVNFNVTGTHYVWIRGYAASNTDDSIHVGLDGTSPAS